MEIKTTTIAEFSVGNVKCSFGDVLNIPEWMHLEIDSKGELVRIYVGTPDHGIVAQYSADVDKWYPCWSKGNFGKNFVSGGNWYSDSRKVCDGYSTLNQAVRAKPLGGIMPKAEAHRNRDYILNYLFGTGCGYE